MKSAFKITLSSMALAAMVYTSSTAAAQPYELSYTGHLVSPDGKAVAGPLDLEVKFFRNQTGGAQIGSTLTFSGIQLSEGVFTLDFSMSLTGYQTVFTQTADVWLEVKNTTDNLVMPRQKYRAVPYALGVPVDAKTLNFGTDGLLTVMPFTSPGPNQFLSKDGTGNFIWATPDTLGATGASGVGNLNLAPQKTLGLGNYSIAEEGALTASLNPADKGKTWFNSGTGMVMVWNGASAASLGGAASSITSLGASGNAQNGSVQVLATGTAGSAPTFTSAANTHTLNIPSASIAGVTAGTISKTQYDTFAAGTAPAGAPTQIQFNNSGSFGANSALAWDNTKQILGVAAVGAGNMFIGSTSGINNSTGIDNTFLGFSTGNANTIGLSNSFIGARAGASNSVGSSNTFVGRNAGQLNSTGSANTYIGDEAGLSNVLNNFNTMIGYRAGRVNTSTGNTFIGSDSGSANSTGVDNTFLGTNSGSNSTIGSQNTFLGKTAGLGNTTGSNNTFIGSQTGQSNTTGGTNTFIGRAAGSANTTGSSNTFIGMNSGLLNTSAGNNTFIGGFSGQSNTIGFSNTFVGLSAGLLNTTGASNTMMGTTAGNSNTTGSNNTFIGTASGYSNTTGFQSTYVGFEAGYSNTTNGQNTMIGYQAGRLNTAAGSTFVGSTAGSANTTGVSNSFVGASAGSANTTGANNSFFGTVAGGSNTTGRDNTFIGRLTGFSNSTGSYNTFVGSSAGFANTTGSNNTFLGYSSATNTTGAGNTFIGTNAGTANIGGSNNTSLGFLAGASITTGTGNVAIGTNSDNGTTSNNATAIGTLAVASGNNSVAIGAGVSSLVANEVLIGTTGLGNKVGIGITPTLDAGYNFEVGGAGRFVGGVCASSTSKGTPACSGITSGQVFGDAFKTIGAYDQVGMAAPAVSNAGSGRLYYDSTSNKFRVSQNGAAFTDLIGSGTVTSITAGTGLSGGLITTSGTIALANTTVVAGAYIRADINVDAQGRLIGATNGTSINLTSDVINTLPITSGGTGQTTTNAALNTFLPNQATNAGKYLSSNGTNTAWATPTVDASGVSGLTSGSIPFSNGSGLTQDNGNLSFDNINKRLGIGNSTPQAVLDVSGQILSRVVNAGASTTINWSQGNTQYTSASCGAFIFSNMLEGGSYTLIVTGATSGTCTFSQSVPDVVSGGSFKMVPANGPTTAATTTLYSFVRAGGLVYVTWVKGF